MSGRITDPAEVLATDQRIRERALHMALDLEHELSPPLRMQLDDITTDADGGLSAEQAAVLTQREQAVEHATVDRVLRHAQLFAEYIGNGWPDDVGEVGGEQGGTP